MIKLKIKEKISIKLSYKSLKVSDKIKDTHLFRKKRHNQTLIQTKFDNFEENPTFSTLDSLMISKFEPKTDVATTRAVSELKRKRKKKRLHLNHTCFRQCFCIFPTTKSPSLADGNRAELTVTKTYGIVTDRQVPSNDPRSLCES